MENVSAFVIVVPAGIPELKLKFTAVSVRVVFSVPGGNYAVPDEFTLMQGGSAMMKIAAAGPWLLIDLPPGAYTLQARVDGRVLERNVNVSRRGSTVYWVVPDSTS